MSDTKFYNPYDEELRNDIASHVYQNASDNGDSFINNNITDASKLSEYYSSGKGLDLYENAIKLYNKDYEESLLNLDDNINKLRHIARDQGNNFYTGGLSGRRARRKYVEEALRDPRNPDNEAFLKAIGYKEGDDLNTALKLAKNAFKNNFNLYYENYLNANNNKYISSAQNDFNYQVKKARTNLEKTLAPKLLTNDYSNLNYSSRTALPKDYTLTNVGYDKNGDGKIDESETKDYSFGKFKKGDEYYYGFKPDENRYSTLGETLENYYNYYNFDKNGHLYGLSPDGNNDYFYTTNKNDFENNVYSTLGLTRQSTTEDLLNALRKKGYNIKADNYFGQLTFGALSDYLDSFTRTFRDKTQYSKKGGILMNKFQNGGLIPEDIKIVAKVILTMAELQGLQIKPEVALQLASKLKQSNPQEFNKVLQAGNQMIQSAKNGAKLNYLKTLNNECPEGTELHYFKAGGKVCKKCIAKLKALKKDCNGNKLAKGGATPQVNKIKTEIAKCGKKIKRGFMGMKNDNDAEAAFKANSHSINDKTVLSKPTYGTAPNGDPTKRTTRSNGYQTITQKIVAHKTLPGKPAAPNDTTYVIQRSWPNKTTRIISTRNGQRPGGNDGSAFDIHTKAFERGK